MAHNQLTGRIPQSVGFMRKLTRLSLESNYLTGYIPQTLSACFKLRTIDLSYNNLTGDIPVTLGNLSNLVKLNLQANQFTGELSSTIFLNASSLEYFDAGENHLSGGISMHICSSCAKLRHLGLFSNHFEGEFPWGDIPCDTLKSVSLWGNRFRGIIPPSIANFSNLEVLNVEQNSFGGRIPWEIGYLSSLTILRLDTNELNGEVPLSVFNLSSLRVLGLNFNNLSGNLPFSIDECLPNIESILIGSNQFFGRIPSSISNLTKLTILELPENSFTGHIPITLGNLRHLLWLNLDKNRFMNNLSIPDQDFLSSLSASNHLKVISVSSNPISGLLPESFGSPNLSASLQQFLARSCQIRSPLPRGMGNLTRLILLDLESNGLSGPIPAALGDLTSLQKLRMYGNMLQGSIPYTICNLGHLYYVDLEGNQLSGQLPSCLGNLSLLREIYLSYNALNFTIPSTVWIDQHVETISISSNFLHGSIPTEIGNLKDLKDLYLYGNQLSGAISTGISQLHKLIRLNLSTNKLNGPILDSFSNLKDLQFLDLSHNHLSGPIPTSLEKLVSLKDFNVSFNELSGEIPNGGSFLNFTLDSFDGNKGLCGAPRFKVGACKQSKSVLSSKNKLLKYVLPVIASVLVVAIVIILVIRRRGGKLHPLFDSPQVLTHERISYYAILKATSNLDEKNLIGRGRFGLVYKGNFPDATVVAVKVFDLDVQGTFGSFDTECQILRSVRHRNLVKVITSCSNLDFKAMVMAYMANGNLEEWLYSDICSLNIFQRLEIMMDVASAVEYLHEGYTFPIVHCDLKPSNILLDEDLVAHVGDFGISKILTEEQRMQQTKTLGTIGYIAPEHGSSGLVSTMVDVYSYGILLMEVFSRRKPTNEMFTGDLTMRRWVFESFPNSVMQIVDEELKNMNDQRDMARRGSCLTSIMEVALECSADMPEERPNMKDVLARMRRINSNLLSREDPE